MRRIIISGVTVMILCFTIALAGKVPEASFTKLPFIDIYQAPDEAMEDGWFRIKFRKELTGHLDDMEIECDDDGIIKTGIPAVDALNSLFRVYEVRGLFDIPALKNGYEWRHRLWGLHLWYELHFDSDEDIRDVIMAYRELKDIIEWAEPEYRKELDADPDFGDFDWGELNRWTPNDPQITDQWHYHNTGQLGGTPGADISLFDAWEIEKGHSDVLVAIIDGGIQYNHPDIAANMWPEIGYNFVTNSTNVTQHNHGTHVAGTVGVVTNNGIGVAGIAGGGGLGDGIRLISCQVFTASSSGGFAPAMIYGADNGSVISQNSWGYTTEGYYDQAVMDAIDYFNANGGGDIMDGGITIFSAGNNNTTGAWYPKCAPSCFSVAGTNNQDVKAWYSTYDTWVNISAPGGETNQVTARGILSTRINATYGYAQGTSMAAPHASGVAALVVSYAHRNGYVLTNNELADILSSTTDPIYHLNPGYLGMLGTGRLNAHAALMALDEFIPSVDNPENFSAISSGYDQIELSWDRNADDDNVLLLVSETGLFGIPVEGELYLIGQEIDGGGTVLYGGADTGFSHKGLQQGTVFHYRAISYTPELEYSSGVTTTAGTDLQYMTLPLEENFDDTDTTPMFWEITDNAGTGQIWEIGVTTDGLVGTSGNYAYINSFIHGSGGYQDSDLITPRLNLRGFQEVSVSFIHYFRQYPQASEAILAYSIDDGENWHTVQNWLTGTTNPAHFQQTIPEVGGQTEVLFKWNYTGSGGYHWCVDNIEISGELVELPAPAELTASAGYQAVELNWAGVNSDNLLGYNIYRNNARLNSEPIIDVNYSDTDVTMGFSYTYQITALYSAGESDPTDSAVVLLELKPPTNLTYELLNGADVTLSWEAPYPEAEDNLPNGRQLNGYIVYRNGTRLNDELIEENSYIDPAIPLGNYLYWVRASYSVGLSPSSNEIVVTSHSDINDNNGIPLLTELRGNSPNPFNPETRIDFSLRNPEQVKIDIYNIKGRKVITLLDSQIEAGHHSIYWNGRNGNGQEMGSGIYFYRMEAGEYRALRKMILIK